ncbi:tRNA (uridine(34)/cytosine(34)/5-carboxymethylaminomethyluridine(34)-2'-O)-methyltransferase TrmL [Clostridium botulinum C]|uniref:tRNA (uridine(34)/cytosine(34)/5- carboxymethylaminomethyluridine(34)-2'-O)- methyltransferase TrmL n=1 Tax=Clostridium botulinum TaxID=1491 RepID=UPI001E2CAFE3|nr:tRNA (uridine(34)/cytosine(34)/5-carboxymethylaminomethyluridine(34)-2'-O)-methyltransferase TrmL [Clostridium botulinum]MCD3216384.1 tRNA (uridine(34)/cytosine(34)/5-carboxymethylaminomethyluridine(34)-2'-O)-methyltransferase TrmL [Clostridium botulinum C]MCD3245018.1 tRNA (uridine(34)/cytosine(34)/5-carboxymethylaminomethyluridine(34)-2'-O)-methyltransferase TrmL [Clostridium botulinum C]MCD3261423.1 tRNA (uridine(34)/cytosine(34)/5-carboxymethylaminomethyluridine(34)-2'-O)-methyltransferas
MSDTPNLNIVLFEPEIPQNTGNIGRTCVLTNSKLHLIKPLGFNIDDKSVKRAGLDYWPYLKLEIHESFDDMIRKYPDANIYLSTTKEAKYHHDEVNYKEGDFIMFGRESSGLPDYIRDRYIENRIRVPMIKTTMRSLNLSNTVSIVVYEALRQLGFPKMK